MDWNVIFFALWMAVGVGATIVWVIKDIKRGLPPVDQEEEEKWMSAIK